MSPFSSNARPSLHDHFSEPSGAASTFASLAGLALRLIGRFGCGRFAPALAAGFVVVAVCAAASVATVSIVVDRAPITAAIISFFMEKTFLSNFSLTRGLPVLA